MTGANASPDHGLDITGREGEYYPVSFGSLRNGERAR